MVINEDQWIEINERLAVSMKLARDKRAPSLIAAAEAYVRDQMNQELTGKRFSESDEGNVLPRDVMTLKDVERVARDAEVEFWGMFSGAVWIPTTELTVTSNGGGNFTIAIKRVDNKLDSRP